ncbi:hypothetical protein NSPZN2_70044 [Nitrospira defluvii]|uniref:Transposase n=1 Tax=Nitrospira defluvii TaxID=330214 RepID=A0ABM8S8T0_9BACT|nr:hypothetical protein NSPZN2_70044 [Nitrospira defluvii]
MALERANTALIPFVIHVRQISKTLRCRAYADLNENPVIAQRVHWIGLTSTVVWGRQPPRIGVMAYTCPADGSRVR